MSLTSRERRNPPTRRKSCRACIKAKRRCDFALPACMRCASRGMACEYPARASRGGPYTPPPGLQEQQPAVTIAGPEIPQLPLPPVDDFLLLDGMLASPDTSHGCSLTDLGLDLDPFNFPMDLVSQHRPTVSAPIGSALAETIKSRLQYGLDQTQKVPAMMAREAATPWSHHMLYRDGMPKSMRDAYACCAMYSGKTKTNGPVILRCIESYVDELLRAEPPSNMQERLAHSQALLLYHIMRLLDGDLRSRSQAEQQLGMLDDSVDALLQYIEFDLDTPGTGRLSLYPLAPTKAFWSNWILQESARRTLLFALYFLQSYRIVAGLQPAECDGRSAACRSLTISSHLWYASSPVAFAQAWNDRRFFVVADCSFEDALEDAAAEDVDTFGRIMLSSCMGIDEAEGWFVTRGSSLWATGAIEA